VLALPDDSKTGFLEGADRYKTRYAGNSGHHGVPSFRQPAQAATSTSRIVAPEANDLAIRIARVVSGLTPDNAGMLLEGLDSALARV
jgi:hypothetical protein